MLLLVLLLSLGVGDVLGVAEFAGVGLTGIDVSVLVLLVLLVFHANYVVDVAEIVRTLKF